MASLEKNVAATSAPTAAPSAPQPSASVAVVHVRLQIPGPAFAKFEARAKAQSRDVEEVISEHLKQTAHVEASAAHLYFNAEQTKKLCALTGRGTCYDSDIIISRLQSLAEISINDVRVPLDATVLDRLKHIGRKRDPQQFVAKEATNGVRLALGLSCR